MTLAIRLLVPDDAALLDAIAADDVDFDLDDRGGTEDRLSIDQLREYLADPTVLHWIAYEGEGVKGVLGFLHYQNERNFESVNNVSVTMNAWHTLKLSVQLEGNSTSKFSIDGTDAVTDDGLDIPFGGPPPSSVTIGPDYKNSPDAFDLHYDNVRIDVVDE